MNAPHWQNDEPETLGRVRITERLDFISKPAAKVNGLSKLIQGAASDKGPLA